ncbi:carbon-nitrogen hydrolase [Nocardiopsis gilva YIM 90087]|uniref:Carbon-nitrogen hydrolase n=1 Tax=Nocardiopsis gilva YIM 90087 TaxID=1235441 RepID=A0A223S4B1_9ACTN|nr:carbon-nitrogen hydrolase family protein [Nocardiopsis gilva]ASU82965.1 carbon-nitrogen hydrolase [Nocardiopsis gilva YIM 90087]
MTSASDRTGSRTGPDAAGAAPALRIALDQGTGASGDVESALRRLDERARAAAEAGARLLIGPEMSMTGYNIGADIDRLAEPADGPLHAEVARIAAATGVALLYGHPEREDGRVYNTVRLIDGSGAPLAGYRKNHLFGDLDRDAFAPGDTPLVQATLDGLRLGLLICYDVEFPEMVRAHALAGTELLLVPTALMRPYTSVATTIVPARALENGLFAAYVNRCDREGELDYCGLSCLIGPDGGEILRAGPDEELLVADVDPAALREARAAAPYLDDRRPELYASLTDG